MSTQYDRFEKWRAECLRDKTYYLNWGGSLFNEALRGANEGDTIFVCGAPNAGKSMVLTSTLINLLKLNDDLVVLDFSVDDSEKKRITQYIANLSNLNMNDVTFANKTLGPNEMALFNTACDTVGEWFKNNRLFVYESVGDGESLTLQASTKFIKTTVEDVRRNNPNKKIVVAIDALNDVELDYGNKKVYTELGEERLLAEEINRIILKNKCLLIATSHLRKNNNRRPTLEDVKGNSFLAYSAKVAIGIFNDMKINKDRCKVSWCEHRKDGITYRMPVIEAHFLKSKVSDFNGVICLKQWPSKGKVEEPDQILQKEYQDMVFGAI